MRNRIPRIGRTRSGAFRELANKLTAYRRFRSVERYLGAVAATASLSEAAGAALALDPVVSPWVLEGLAYARTESKWAEGEPRGFLIGQGADELAPASLLPLHTGLGLSLARRSLARLGLRPDENEVAHALERFVVLCHANARPEYLEATLEAAGFVGRVLRPRLVPSLARASRNVGRADAGTDLTALLWHGAGRGLYFSPGHLLPFFGQTGRALRSASDEPDEGTGRANAVAGLAFALTLVNLHHPEILVRTVTGLADAGVDPRAFAHGVASAVVLRTDVIGVDPALAALLAHSPGSVAGRRLDLWEAWMLRPTKDAAERLHPELRERGELASIFRVPREGVS